MSTTTAAPAVSKPLLIVLGSVVGLVALYFLVVSPLLLSAEEPADTLVIASPGSEVDVSDLPDGSTASGADVATDGALPTEEPAPEAFEIYSARDPFEQLVQLTPDGTAEAASDGTALSDATAIDGGTDTTGTTDTDTDSTDTGATLQGASVVLEDVVSDGDVLTASVNVGGTRYEVREGDTFAGSHSVLALAGECGTLLLGQEQVVLCEGDEASL